jgi:hypothetical protein
MNMKAKIKKTGEIMNIASDAEVILNACDRYGNPIKLGFDDVEILEEKSTMPDSCNYSNTNNEAFEYKTFDNITLEQVNELGCDGWELLFIEHDKKILVPVKRFWFKREIINRLAEQNEAGDPIFEQHLKEMEENPEILKWI